MDCPKCSAANKPGRRFCAACGSPFTVACPACGFMNEPDDRFCGGCGIPLGIAAVSKSAAPSAAGELRPVTILFCDLSGYTVLSNRLDAEDTQALLNRFFASADAAVAAKGGTIDKHIGDCIMAVFGAPTAHDDDAARAISAALAIHAAVSEFGAEQGLEAHSGIAGGVVAAGETGSDHHRSYTVTGAVVNLASRLCDIARPGEILVARDVAEAVAHGFDMAAHEPVSADGFSEPIAVASVLGSRVESARSRAGPLVGRQHELRQIRAALSTVSEMGRGQVLVLRGEAGIGKSRLAEEALNLARTLGVQIFTAGALSFGGGRETDPSRVLLRAFAGLSAGAGQDDLASLERAAEAAQLPRHVRALAIDLAGFPVEGELHSDLDALGMIGRSAGRAEALARLAASAARQPSLILVEDVHWAERETLDHLAALAAALTGNPVLLLLTTRMENDPIDAGWRGAARNIPFTAIDLSPIEREDAQRLAAFLMGESFATSEIVARAGGNPLFLVQLLHHAMQDRRAPLPASIQSLIAARLDRVGAEERRVIQAAAALGLRFEPDDLAFLAGDCGAELQSLAGRHLLRMAGNQIEFVHALVREAVYEMLPKARRRELHARAAERFAGRDAALAAQHLELAGDGRAAIGYHDAAEQARQNYRHAQARELNARGSKLAKSDEDKVRLALQRGQIVLDAGEARDSVAVWRGAIALAPRGSRDLAKAETGLAQALRIIDQWPEALQALERAEPAAAAHGDGELLSLIHHVRANLLFPLARADECLREHQSSLDWARKAGSVEAEVRALGGLGDAHYIVGRVESAHGAYKSCVRLAHQHGFGRIELANLPMMALTGVLCGRVAASWPLVERTIETSRLLGLKRAELIALHCVAIYGFLQEKFTETRTALRRADEIVAELGARRFEAESLAFLAAVERMGGNRAAALDLARKSWASAQSTDITYMGPLCLAEVAAATDDADERAAALVEIERLLQQGCVAHNYYHVYQTMSEVSLLGRDWDGAEAWARKLRGTMTQEPFFFADYLSRWAMALARAGRGERAADGELDAIAAEGRAAGYTRAAAWAEKEAAAMSADALPEPDDAAASGLWH